MSDLLPDRLPGSASPKITRQAARAEHETALAIRRHELLRDFDRACEAIDNETLVAGVQEACEAELKFLEDGLKAAGDSAAARAVVAGYASLLNKANLARLARRNG